ncbi:hypothetical protein [Magnetofaba australis]|uniref:Putative decarboxylase, BtrK-related protein n=1 Tax=Magnetofaba australis IT-1 TaxID=1434232 RepID=A0A1Y2K7X7_9PROT|nr:hypothetical protein [Magnetofaba australis]OSM06163.1 putative decarboxylase, BtrK-related protein [Magnetofaba australis IT-1]
MSIPPRVAAAPFQTPAYLYDERTMQQRCAMVASHLGEHLRLYYAIKANPSLGVLRALRMHVGGVDISSGIELERALKTGFDPAHMSFAGPGKSDAELRAAVLAGVGAISVESLAEAMRLQRIARETHRSANILLRLNPAQPFPGFAIKMGGKPTPFGIEEAQAPLAIQQILDSPGLNLRGFHVYAGTQCLQPQTLIDNFAYALKMIGQLAADFHLSPELINFGGGLGVAYHEGQQELDAAEALPAMCDLFEQARQSPRLAQCEGIIELGRYLMAEAGWYLTTVTDVKQAHGQTFCVCDGGMHHYLAASGNFGQVIRKNYRVANLDADAEREVARVTLAGPLCTTLDVLAQQAELPVPRVGERLAILHAGAYGLSASPLLFLSHKTPWEYLLDSQDALQTLREPVDPSGLGELG